MGFMKFLKKKEDDLDIPPMPPGIEEDKKQMAPLPDFPEISVPDAPPEPIPEMEPMSEQDIIEKVNVEKESPPEPEPVYQTEQEEEPRQIMETPKDSYIKAPDFQKVLGRIKTGKRTCKKAEDKLFALSEIKNKEEKELNAWKNKLEDIQRKLIYVDKVLFENDG